MKHKVDSFIGSTFPTPIGGTLTVTGKIKHLIKGRPCIYTTKCSVCSEDKELFSEEFSSAKGDLKRGRVPCGCALNPRLTQDQYMVKVIRKCEERDYAVQHLSVIWKGHKTKLHLKCSIDSTEWSTTTIERLLKDTGGCPTCARGRTTQGSLKPISEFISSFIATGKYPVGTVFTKNKYKRTKLGSLSSYDMYCPVCSTDDYVKAGVCTGVFTSDAESFKAGQKPCRCIKQYRWSESQREYQIDSICKREGYKFSGWRDITGYTNYRSKFKWTCKNGHSCITQAGSFITGGSRCGRCCNKFGFYPERADDPDNLYLLSFKGKSHIKDPENFIKIGRSFNLKERITKLKKAGYEIIVLAIAKMNHREVYEIEQQYHEDFEDFNFNPNTSFAGDSECFTFEILEYLSLRSDGSFYL